MKRKIFYRIMLAVVLGLLVPNTSHAGKHVILTTPEEYQILDISPNGLWACGLYVDYSYSGYAFRWNLLTGETELLSTSAQSDCWTISNDGTVAGAFYTEHNGSTKMLPGQYYDGAWHAMEMPAEDVAGGIGFGITPDGHYMTGSLQIGKIYKAYIWKDGRIYRVLSDNATAMPYCISPDGQSASGWIDTGNRQACLWKADGTTELLSDFKSPWSSGRNFSPDGSKLLFWGGWNSENETTPRLLSLYDLSSGVKSYVTPIDQYGSFELWGISNNGMLGGENGGRGYINVDKLGRYADEYLASQGVDIKQLNAFVLEGTDYPQIIRVQDFNEDGSIIGIAYYANTGDGYAALRSAVIKLDFDASNLQPSSVRVSQLNGILANKLTWLAPAGAEGIQSFNIYRNGAKVATVSADVNTYIDSNLSAGTYSYQVTAVYGGSESQRSETASVEVVKKVIEAPQDLLGRQKGYNSAFLSWMHPRSNYITKTYTDISNANVSGFGPGSDNVSFESGVRFDAHEVSAYKGCKVSKVEFYPLSEQKDWTLNLYTYKGGTLTLLYSQPITQSIELGKMNTVELATPQELPEGDLIAAVSVLVPSANNNVIGMDYGKAVAGFSDLVRLSTDPDFYSVSDRSSASGYMYRTSWLMNVILKEEGSAEDADVLSHYTVFADGKEVMTTKGTTAVISALSEGSHTFGVNAVYANGNVSENVNVTKSIRIDNSCLTGVDEMGINFEGNTMTAVWGAPKDKDAHKVSYAGETPNSISVSAPSGNNNIIFAHDYPAAMFKGYYNYYIAACRFYPLQDAIYTVLVYEDGKLVAEQPVDNLTINQWNSVRMETPVKVKEGSTYRIAIDCYDIDANKYIIAVDTEGCKAGFADLYSLDGETFSLFTADTGLSYNTMIGVVLEDKEGTALPAKGYDVNIDGIKQNKLMLTSTSYTHEFLKDNKDHKISVDTYYDALQQSVKGTNVIFKIGVSNGIEENTIAEVKIVQENSTVSVTAENVTKLALIAADGAEVAVAYGNSLAVGNVPEGVYILKAVANGEELVRKIRIKK